jgi:glycosyltransferase involved in cell wall biosynthesis
VRVGIDLRPLETASGRRGVGTYLDGLVSALIREDRREEIVLFHSDGAPPDSRMGLPAPGVHTAALTRPKRATTLWDQIAWPPTLSRWKVDVFHSPFWTVPVLVASRHALVQTIHDLSPLKIRGSVSLKNRMIFRANFACARLARRIIVPSRATAEDAVALAGIAAERIRPVPEGVSLGEDLLRLAQEVLPSLRGRLGIPGRYLLHTGGHDPVKDLGTAIRATARLAAEGHDLKLVVTGEAGPSTGSLRRMAASAGLGDRLVLPGFLARSDLVALYRGAAALIYPSLNEGFGLPVVEAMACGTPVVAARAGALPEVGGDACRYGEPGDAASFAATVAEILTDDALARRLSEAGRVRAARFTWQAAARGTLQVYREAAE